MILGRKKTVDLYGECSATLKGDFEIKALPKPTNNKVTCYQCGRRRYGGSYEVSKKKVTQ